MSSISVTCHALYYSFGLCIVNKKIHLQLLASCDFSYTYFFPNFISRIHERKDGRYCAGPNEAVRVGIQLKILENYNRVNFMFIHRNIIFFVIKIFHTAEKSSVFSLIFF